MQEDKINTSVESPQILEPVPKTTPNTGDVTRPVEPQPKNKLNFLLVIVIIVLLSVISVLSYLLYHTNNKRQLAGKATSSPTPITKSKETPLNNTLYLGKYKDGSEVIYLSTNEMRKNYEYLGRERNNSLVGLIRTADGVGISPADFSEISNPVKLFTYEKEEIYSINNFIFDKDRKYLYVVFQFLESPSSYPDITDKIFQIDTEKHAGKILWSHKVGDSKYPKKGPADVIKITDNKYLEIHLGICNACGAWDPFGTVLINLETGKEKYLGQADNLQFNFLENKLSYQKLAPFEEDCGDPSPACSDNGKWTIYKPAGEVFTVPLP